MPYGRPLIIFISALSLVSLACSPPDPSGDSDYVFVPIAHRYVVILHGKRESFGTLDAAGNFVPNPKLLNIERQPYSGPMRPGQLVNFPDLRHPNVFEYRSGRLIPGRLDDQGNFIPKLGGKIISLKDYHYSKSAPRIWNLPGHFVKKKDLKRR
jgi:hypothetical protein